MLQFAPSGRSPAIGALVVLVAGGSTLARDVHVRRAVGRGRRSFTGAAETAELRSFGGRSLVSLNGGVVEQRVDGLAAVRSSVVDRASAGRIRVAGVRRRAPAWRGSYSRRGRVVAIALATHRDLHASGCRRGRRFPRAFLTDEPGALAACSLAAFVGSAESSRLRARARRSDHARSTRGLDPARRPD